MADVATIYAAMRGSEMNEWVGGADPELAGRFSHHMIARMVRLGDKARVLDLGCGNGRVALALLASDHPPRRLLGLDIVPALVDFCREAIGGAFPQAAFDLLAGENDHYERYKSQATPKTRDRIIAENPGRFTVAYALSVFTHIAPGDFTALLAFAAALLRPRGELLFTAFTLTAYSRRQIERGRATFPMDRAEYREDGAVLVARPNDPLAFIAYDRTLIERYIWEAGLILTRVEYGNWMGGKLGTSLQDVYVCRKAGSATLG